MDTRKDIKTGIRGKTKSKKGDIKTEKGDTKNLQVFTLKKMKWRGKMNLLWLLW